MEPTQQNIDKITPLVIGILDDWRLNSEQILAVLGLQEKAQLGDLRKYRQRAQPLPFSDDLAVRIDHIAGIAEAMRTAFPFGSGMQYMWINRPHRRFSRKTPLDVMVETGTAGLLRVRTELDCAYGWSVN